MLPTMPAIFKGPRVQHRVMALSNLFYNKNVQNKQKQELGLLFPPITVFHLSYLMIRQFILRISFEYDNSTLVSHSYDTSFYVFYMIDFQLKLIKTDASYTPYA